MYTITNYVVNYRKTAPTVSNWNVLKSVDKSTTAKVTGLTANTKYEFAVAADYGICTGEMSAPSEECTTDAVAPPSDVMKTISFREIIQIKWNPPSFISKGHFIKKYKVKYQPADATDITKYEEVETEKCHYTLQNLDPSTTYKISVSALCGDNGESAAAEIKADTAENPPAPGSLAITSKTHGEVRLEWSKPGSDKHHIQGYVLHYRDMSASNDGWTVQETKDQYTSSALTGLSPNTNYQFKVAADYGVCTGEMSGTSKMCTTYVATCPTHLTPKMLFREFMQIEWNPPSFVCKGYSVSKYRVKYYPATDRDDSHPMQEETQGATCIHTLRNLKPSTHYKISLTALLNNNGESVPSDFTKIGTSSKKPPAPSKPGIRSKTHNSVSLTWNEPAGNTYNITNFVVNYREKAPTLSKWRMFKSAGSGAQLQKSQDLLQTPRTNFQWLLIMEFVVVKSVLRARIA